MNGKTKKLTTIAMLCAITYVVMAVGNIGVQGVQTRLKRNVRFESK